MSYQITKVKYFVFIIIFLLISSCAQKEDNAEDKSSVTIVFKHGKIAGDPMQFKKLLEKFELENPGIKVKDETLPSSTDEQHQFYVLNLEGKSSDFDVLSMDVIWVPEFARAEWLRDLSHLLSEQDRSDFFPGPLRAVTYRDKIYAVPWYIDAGVLYYRKDLLGKYGFSPPKTWQELVSTAQYITSREHGLYGYIWQGKQYEGLVCNVLEFLWGNGGDVLRGEEVIINSPENIHALQFMRDLITKYYISPPLVITSIEESTRHMFGNGKVLFMRNWPYALHIVEREGSLVKGKVGVSPLPSFPGKISVSTLGGWQLGVNRYSKHPEAAERLIEFLVSPESLKILALTIGYKPARKSLYKDDALIKSQPFIVNLYEVFMKAKPRPVSPYYMMITQVMQPEFSASISGMKTPEEAMKSLRKQISYIIGAKK